MSKSPQMDDCCCKNDMTDKIGVSCLNRCYLNRHKCVRKKDVRPRRIPKNMGWLFNAEDSPSHQLRCGWRPGHIACPVLRRMQATCCGNCDSCCSPGLSCSPLPCEPPKCPPSPKCPSSPKCPPKCPSSPKCPPKCPSEPKGPPNPKSSSHSSSNNPQPTSPEPSSPDKPSCNNETCTQPSIRIVRHNGQYSITTKPSNISNHPSGPYPLKYALDVGDYPEGEKAIYALEARYNDYVYDCTVSQDSFVLEFSPPEGVCCKSRTPKRCSPKVLYCAPPCASKVCFTPCYRPRPKPRLRRPKKAGGPKLSCPRKHCRSPKRCRPPKRCALLCPPKICPNNCGPLRRLAVPCPGGPCPDCCAIPCPLDPCLKCCRPSKVCGSPCPPDPCPNNCSPVKPCKKCCRPPKICGLPCSGSPCPKCSPCY